MLPAQGGSAPSRPCLTEVWRETSDAHVGQVGFLLFTKREINDRILFAKLDAHARQVYPQQVASRLVIVSV